MNSGFTATRSGPLCPWSGPENSEGRRTRSVVPGRTVLRSTTVNGSSRPASARPSSRPTRSIASASSCPLARPGVPTQINATSERSTASLGSVVAHSRPSPTTSLSSSPRPGSTTGGEDSFSRGALSGFTSAPITSWPVFARQAAVTQPTYPSPNTLTRTADLHLSFVRATRQKLLRLATDAGFDEIVAAADLRHVSIVGIGDVDRSRGAAATLRVEQSDLVGEVRMASAQLRLDEGVHRDDQRGALQERARHRPRPMALEIDPEVPGGDARARIGGLALAGVEAGRTDRDGASAPTVEAPLQERLRHRAADDVAATDVHDAADRPGRLPRRYAQAEGSPDPETPVDPDQPCVEGPVRPRQRQDPARQPPPAAPEDRDAAGAPPRGPPGAGPPDGLGAERLEVLRHPRPAEAVLDQPPSRGAERRAAPGIAQERDDGPSELLGIVHLQEVHARDEGKPLRPHGRRDYGLPRRQRLEYLETRSAAESQRHDVHHPLRE